MREHPAVNRRARRVKQTTQCVVCSQSVSGFVIREGTVGSNPTRGAKKYGNFDTKSALFYAFFRA